MAGGSARPRDAGAAVVRPPGDRRVELLAFERLQALEGRWTLTGHRRPVGSVVRPRAGVTLRVMSYNPLSRVTVRQKATETVGAMITRALGLLHTRARERADQTHMADAIRRQSQRRPSKDVH
jgi:hypothetical protein